MTAADDARHLARAARLAERGLFTTDPNPRVGCVLEKDGDVIAEGWHERAGGPHAERVALDVAGDAARGSTAYVSLEPCCFEGRTGECSEALIAAGVARVVCASIDPHPKVSGSGIEQLRGAGIDVDVIENTFVDDLNPGYVSRLTRGRPWVRVKIAASLDGRTALTNGVSQWITGPAARADVHRWRARSSAVLTGIGTVLADDPRLDARPEDPVFDPIQPLRVVLDSRLRTPPDATVLGTPEDVLIFTTVEDDSPEVTALSRRASIERVGGSPHCDLSSVLMRLAELEINELWVEAGSAVSGALLREGLVDELLLYYAPHVLGDAARGMFDIGSLTAVEQRVELEMTDFRRVGDDLRITLRPRTVAGP